jgi:hypothetical protein
LPYTVLKIPLVKSYILSICNYTLASSIAPPLWLNSAIIPLHKKGNFNDPSNYRGIALTSTAAKIFNKMLLHRLRSLIDHKLRPSQNGFRPHRSCTQHILALRRIIENCTIYKRHSVLITFIDFSKAFDSISRQYLQDTLFELDIPTYLINAIFSLYRGSTSQVMTPHGLTDKIRVDRGVLQGDTLAPYLFVLVLDRVLRRALDDKSWGYCHKVRRSSRSADEFVTDLTYADDIAAVSTTFEDAQAQLTAIANEGKAAGLAINGSKTELLVVGDLAAEEPERTLSLYDNPIKRVTQFVYLGSQIASSKQDTARRIRLASHHIGLLQPVWKAPLSPGLKLRLFRTLIEPILFYACETWILPTTAMEQLRRAHNVLLRRALGIRWSARVPNAEIFSRTPSADIIVEERTLRFLGHISRFILNPSSLQPVNDLLWFAPARCTRRPAGRNAVTFHTQLRRTLGRDLSLIDIRSFAEGDKLEFTDWYTARCSNRWTRWSHQPTQEEPVDPPQNN